jgi:hypothetical protein
VGVMSRALLVEQRLEEAKRSMRYAFYKPGKPASISRGRIDAELRRNGFKLGIKHATDEQVRPPTPKRGWCGCTAAAG